MNAITNPEVTFPFCADQTDFLCFRSTDGFAAVYLDLVEGFIPSAEFPGHTTITLTNNSEYHATETVPQLVVRFAAVKRLRYAKDRGDVETTGAGGPSRAMAPPVSGTPPTLPSTTEVVGGAKPATRSGIWKTPGAT